MKWVVGGQPIGLAIFLIIVSHLTAYSILFRFIDMGTHYRILQRTLVTFMRSSQIILYGLLNGNSLIFLLKKQLILRDKL